MITSNPHRKKRQLELINRMYPNGINDLIQEAEAARQEAAEAARQKIEQEQKEYANNVNSILAILGIAGGVAVIAAGLCIGLAKR